MAQATKEKAIKQFNFYDVAEDDSGPFGKIQNELEKLEEEEKALQDKLDLIHPRMQFLHDKARKLYDVFKSVAAGLVIQPYDAALLAAVKGRLKGWALLKPESSDQEVLDLFKICREYRNYTKGELTRGYNDREIYFWASDRSSNNPTLKGDQLIAEIRRVLGIEKPKQAAKPATKSKTVGELAKKIEKKVAKAPATPKTLNQWLAGAKASAKARKVKDIDWEDPFWKEQFEKSVTARDAVEHWEVQPRLFDSKLGKPEAPKAETPRNGTPLPGFRKQTLGQFMSTVRGVLASKTTIEIDDRAPYWQKALDEGKRPSDAAREWLEIETSKDAIAKDPIAGGPGAAPPMKKDADHPAQLASNKLSQVPGLATILKPGDLTVAPIDLLTFHSDALYVDEDEIPAIGGALNTNKGYYAVIQAHERSSSTTYVLQPVSVPTDQMQQSKWAVRRSNYPKTKPEDTPLMGVVAYDDAGDPWVFGADSDRLYVEVPKVKSKK